MSFFHCERHCVRPMLESYNELLSVKDLSEILKISIQTVRKEMKNGKFGVPLRFGREYRVPKKFIVEKFIHGYTSPVLTKGEFVND